MMAAVIVGLVVAAELWAQCAFQILYLRVNGRHPGRLLRAIFWGLRPFFLPIVTVWGAYAVFLIGGWAGVAVAISGLAAFLLQWLLLKDANDDDGWWRRRRRKLAEKIRRSGARLVVVPARGAR
jgi:hypothetical protein